MLTFFSYTYKHTQIYCISITDSPLIYCWLPGMCESGWALSEIRENHRFAVKKEKKVKWNKTQQQ